MKKTTKLLKINTCRMSPLLVYFEYCKMGGRSKTQMRYKTYRSGVCWRMGRDNHVFFY